MPDDLCHKFGDSQFDYNNTNPFTPLQLDPSDYDEDFSDEERAQECYEATLEALWYIAAEITRMGIDPKYIGVFASGMFENSGGLHENMVEQNENPRN